jgi:hypothetical protein
MGWTGISINTEASLRTLRLATMTRDITFTKAGSCNEIPDGTKDAFSSIIRNRSSFRPLNKSIFPSFESDLQLRS